MDELKNIYGPIGLGLITFALPYLLEVFKRITNWDDWKMLVTSIVSTYFLVDLLVLSTSLNADPSPNLPSILFLVLGMVLYPLPVWFGTQGVYTRMINRDSV